MGCDIHMVVEVNHEGTWIGLHMFPYYAGYASTRYSDKFLETLTEEQRREISSPSCEFMHPLVMGRNYDLFAKLAGVRGRGPQPKGMPEDASNLSRMAASRWGEDGHSHSYCPLKTFIETAVKTHQLPDPVRQVIEKGESAGNWIVRYAFDYFDVSEADVPNARVVFWFDN